MRGAEIIMIGKLKIILLVTAAVIFQVTVIPRYLADPFQPNLLILFVVHAGLRWQSRWGAPAAFMLGLIQDSFSGIYFGLNGFSFLLIFFILDRIADRLYTDSRLLMVLATFIATLINSVVTLCLLVVFSEARGIYVTLIFNLLPQAALNAWIALSLEYLLPERKVEGTQ